MIKLGHTDHKGNASHELDTLKKQADILEDNGETRAKKAFWKKTQFKT